jgi:acyl-CoA thioesterase-1
MPASPSFLSLTRAVAPLASPLAPALASAPALALALAATVTACGDAPPRPDEAPAERPAATATSATATSDTAAPGAPASGDARPVVVFMGTSLTAGLGLREPGERYPDRLAATADSAGTPFRAVNSGVSGETSAGGLRRLDWVLEQPMDVLVIELGANDALRGQDPVALEANLRAIVRRSREAHEGLEVLVLGMEAPPNLGPAYTRRFRELFARVARDEGAAFVPFLLEGVAGEAELNQPDGIHPTAAGHRLMARTVWPVLDSLLRLGGPS